MADEQAGNESEGSGLRKQLEEALEENHSLKSERRERAFKDAGFDPAQGVGQLLANQYDGEATSDAIREFAQGFGLGGDEEKPGGEQLSEDEQNRLDGDQRLSAASKGSLPARTPDTNDEIRKAEAEGDWDESNRLKAQQLEALRS